MAGIDHSEGLSAAGGEGGQEGIMIGAVVNTIVQNAPMSKPKTADMLDHPAWRIDRSTWMYMYYPGRGIICMDISTGAWYPVP
jgi:hypothetical protein